ncbi:hypothetical protein IJN73_00945 [Candidatus Saccharibacteria bacterium]|nr:hypothetical protein [Candidatus Saccharibacteria bacterium]
MENFRRLFVVKNGESSGWTNSDRTSFIISVEDDELKVLVKKGRDPYAYEINTAFGRFLKEYERENGKVERYKRSRSYRFCFRNGSSGCQDTFIEIDVGDGFPERKFLMHKSMYRKCGGFHCFIYDFLDLCVAEGFFSIVDGFYAYNQEEDARAEEIDMQVIKPRLLEYEEGWMNPWRVPDDVVYLKVCRKEPETEEPEVEEEEKENEENEEDGDD